MRLGGDPESEKWEEPSTQGRETLAGPVPRAGAGLLPILTFSAGIPGPRSQLIWFLPPPQGDYAKL